jgi:hypothetical protein
MRSLNKLPPAHVCAAELEKRRNEQRSSEPAQPTVDDRRDPRVAEAAGTQIQVDLS